jgi:TIR domain
MERCIGDWLEPTFFISYSRKQERFAVALKTRLLDRVRSVWFDRDHLQPGDRWRQEIARGIAASDELIPLLSDDSILSPVVNEEIAIAKTNQKAIRPVIIQPLTKAMPEQLSEFQYLDLSGMNGLDQQLDAITRFVVDSDHPTRQGDTIKLKACRGIYPAFAEDLLRSGSPGSIAVTAAKLNTLRGLYNPDSVIWLNAGLASCIGGDWDLGLETLRAHAAAANSFPAWYFLALHLPRARFLSRTPVPVVREALDNAERALACSRHPLALLLMMLIETGGMSYGLRNLEHRVAEFYDALTMFRAERSETMRAFWCLKASFSLLGGYEKQIRDTLRELAR